jgi:hypothetical protein
MSPTKWTTNFNASARSSRLLLLSFVTWMAGPAVWIFRWRENAAEGRVYRKVVVGTVEQFPTKTAPKHAVETLRSTIKAGNAAVPLTVRQLVKHYEDNELPKKAWSTQRTFETTHRIWVLPNWGEHKLVDVKTVQVESWLHGLSLANHTKAKIRNVMHIVFTHACLHESLDKNPMTLVRQSAKRQMVPDVPELDELKTILRMDSTNSLPSTCDRHAGAFVSSAVHVLQDAVTDGCAFLARWLF